MYRRIFVKYIAGAAGTITLLPYFIKKSFADNLGQTMTEKTYYTHDYSPRDHEIVEYSFHEHPALPGILLRGPAIDVENRDDYFSCIGAAQTLGPYVSAPFPELLTAQLGIPSWNLGVGGASPYFFLQHPELIKYVNKGKFAILQVMTARDEPNDRQQPTAIASIVKDLKHGDTVPAQIVWQRIMEEEPENIEKYISQSQEHWEADMKKLVESISVPVIHFWFSPKSLDAKVDLKASKVIGIIDNYPQFINRENLGYIDDLDTELVLCSSDRGETFTLRSRFTGKSVEVDYAASDKSGKMASFKESVNVYYPSPQMHWDAAMVLGEVIRNRGLDS